MNLGKKNKDEIESEQVDSNGTHSSSNLPGDPIHSPQLFPGGNTGSSANVDGRELLVQKEVYKGKEVAKAVNSEDNSGKGSFSDTPLNNGNALDMPQVLYSWRLDFFLIK